MHEASAQGRMGFSVPPCRLPLTRLLILLIDKISKKPRRNQGIDGQKAPASARAFPNPIPNATSRKNAARTSCDQYAGSAASDLAKSVSMPEMLKRTERKIQPYPQQHNGKAFVFDKTTYRQTLCLAESPLSHHREAFSDMRIDAGFERILCLKSLSAESPSGWHCPFITDEQSF